MATDATVADALRAATRPARQPPLPVLQRALVVGAGGALGSAVLAEALVAGRFQRVAAVVTGPLRSALRGLQALPAAALDGAVPLPADVAFLVFERARHANGRDDAYLQPDAHSLLPLAAALNARGVRRLVVVVPHAPALLPQALKRGFASRAEGAVAALGFEHLVFIRSAQTGAAAGGNAVQRFAGWWLSQLRWMVPQHEQPVRAARVAALAVLLAQRLPLSAPGTRVLPPELLSQAAAGDSDAVIAAWLAPPRHL